MVFMPIMRVHSTRGSPSHFPWLYGTEAEHAMRRALELRYRLIPYHYSLAHAMFLNRRLWMRPMVMAFPEDPAAADLVSQWLDGDLLVAPILNEDNITDVYLPSGIW